MSALWKVNSWEYREDVSNIFHNTRCGLCLDIKIRVPCFTASVSSNILVLSNVILVKQLAKYHNVWCKKLASEFSRLLAAYFGRRDLGLFRPMAAMSEDRGRNMHDPSAPDVRECFQLRVWMHLPWNLLVSIHEQNLTLRPKFDDVNNQKTPFKRRMFFSA